MSEQECAKCGRMLRHGENIKACIVTRFVALKSKAVYAMEQPSECKWMEHIDCSYFHEGD